MKYLTKNKAWDIVEDYNVDKLLYLLIDRPYMKNHVDTFVWLNKGRWHRDYDLPSYIIRAENITWHKYGPEHRENNKPALIRENGTKEHWLNGIPQLIV